MHLPRPYSTIFKEVQISYLSTLVRPTSIKLDLGIPNFKGLEWTFLRK